MSCSMPGTDDIEMDGTLSGLGRGNRQEQIMSACDESEDSGGIYLLFILSHRFRSLQETQSLHSSCYNIGQPRSMKYGGQSARAP